MPTKREMYNNIICKYVLLETNAAKARATGTFCEGICMFSGFFQDFYTKYHTVHFYTKYCVCVFYTKFRVWDISIVTAIDFPQI